MRYYLRISNDIAAFRHDSHPVPISHVSLLAAATINEQTNSTLSSTHKFKYSEYMNDDSKDTGNSTQIIQKALETHTGIVDVLLKSGADATIKDKKGNLAVDFDYKPPAPKPEKPSPSEVSQAATMAALDAALGESSAKKDL